jgi:hypothetical protein
LKVVLGNLKDKADDLLAFLEPRVGTKPSLDGGAIAIDDSSVRKGVKPRHVKTYVKRYLQKKGLRRKFRILVKAGELTVVELEGVEEEELPEKPKAEVAKPEVTKEPEVEPKKEEKEVVEKPKKEPKVLAEKREAEVKEKPSKTKPRKTGKKTKTQPATS